MATKEIANKLIDMESRLKEIISVTEDLKLRSEEGEVLSKQQRFQARAERRATEFSSIDPEIRLKRFLYIGDETPLFQPGTLELKLSRSKVKSVVELIDRYQNTRKKTDEKTDLPKHTEEDIPVLVMISKALSDPHNPNPECPIFALAMVVRCSTATSEVKEAAYNVARRCLVTFEQLTAFVKHATSMHRENKQGSNSGGWGGGMRRLVAQWYLKQDPVQLARSVAHYSKQHLWAHKDLFKLTHFKPPADDVALQAIVTYVLRSLQVTEEKFGKEEKASKVMEEFRKRKEELQADEEQLCQLIEARKLKYHDVRSDKLKASPKLWCAVLKNMSPEEILTLMPSILWLRFKVPSSSNAADTDRKAAEEARKAEERKAGDEVRKLACELLTKEGVKVPPAQVYVVLKNYQKALKDKGFIFNSPYLLDKKLKETITAITPCTMSVTAMEKLLANSLTKLTESKVRILVSVDLRSSDETCQWTHSVSPLQACALVSMYLSRSHKICNVMAFTEGKEMQPISVSATMTLDKLIETFELSKSTAKKEPEISEPMEFSKERNREYDVFVVLTPSLKSWKWKKGHEVAKALQDYRDKKNRPEARLAVCAFGNMSMFVSTNKSNGMLDLAGFSTNTIPVLSNFCQGNF